MNRILPLPIIHRPKKNPPPGVKGSWLISFADMVTLVLTFMVLMISITTLDPHTDLKATDGTADELVEIVDAGSGVLLYSNRGLMAPALELVENLIHLPENLMFDQQEIKSAIFQLDPAKTPDYEQLREDLDERISIKADSRGLIIQWDRSLLFPEGGAIMFEDNLTLLQKLAIFLQNVSLPVSVEGHTNSASLLEGGETGAAYALSMRRAKVVMEYLVSLGLPEKRFRIGGFGGSRPLSDAPDLAWQNSRLDIIIYRPEPSSLMPGR